MKTKIRMLFFFLFMLVSLTMQAQNTYYVNDNSTVGDVYCTAVGNDATNVANNPNKPSASLSDAIAAAANGDTIYVDKGVWIGTEVIIDKELTIIGAGNANTLFRGHESDSDGGNMRFANITANNVIVKGMTFQWFSPTATGARIFEISGKTGIILENMVIKDNRGTSTTNSPNINISSSSNVTINNLLFSCSGQGADNGGAIYVSSSTLIINESIFKNSLNSNGNGGAINIIGSSSNVTINSVTFAENKAVSHYLEDVASVVNNMINSSNFYNQIIVSYKASGVYGTSVLLAEEDIEEDIRFLNLPIKQVCIVEDARGRVYEYYI
jgi:hypothetical protein